jgi:dTDP-4-amino-4,6-dideoxygalactose transaminase
MGEMGCFSFYPGKNLGAYGEGGCVTTNNPEYAKTIRMLRDWGQEKRYDHVLKGFNYRLEGIQGAILGVKLRHLDDWTSRRQAAAAVYGRQLSGTGVCTPRTMPWGTHVFHLYAVRSSQRWELHRALQAKDIQVGVHYPLPIHLLGAWKELNYTQGAFPVAEQAAEEVLSLPIFPELTTSQIAEIGSVVEEFHVVRKR